MRRLWPLAQLVERRAVNSDVAGSRPARPAIVTNFFSGCCIMVVPLPSKQTVPVRFWSSAPLFNRSEL